MAVDAEIIKITSILTMILTTVAVFAYWIINFLEADFRGEDNDNTFKKRMNSFWSLVVHAPYAAAWFYFMFYLYCAPGIETATVKNIYKYDIVKKIDGTYVYNEANGTKLSVVLEKPEDYMYVIYEYDSSEKNGMIYTNFLKYKYAIEKKQLVPTVIEKEEEHF